MPLWHYGHIFCFSLEKNFFTFIKRRALKYETLVGSLDCCRNLSLPFQRLYICSILVARGSLSHRPKCLFQSVFSFLFSLVLSRAPSLSQIICFAALCFVLFSPAPARRMYRKQIGCSRWKEGEREQLMKNFFAVHSQLSSFSGRRVLYVCKRVSVSACLPAQLLFKMIDVDAWCW